MRKKAFFLVHLQQIFNKGEIMSNTKASINFQSAYNNMSLHHDLSEISRCLLCDDPVCDKACPKNVPISDVIKAIYFEDFVGGIKKSMDVGCESCSAPCEKACVLAKEDIPVKISEIIPEIVKGKKYLTKPALDDVDLSMEICGVKLENPFILSSSVVASSYDMCKRAFEAGWAGASYKTICSFTQHEASPRFSAVKKHSNSFFGFKNIEQLSNHSVEEDLEVFRRVRKEFPTKIIIASIMGQNEEEWTSLARRCEEAGASIIECNFSCPNMENDDLGVTIGQSEELVERFMRATKKGTSLPVLAKLTPNITDMVPIAIAAKRGGADGIAAINTINSITGVNIDTYVAEPVVNGKSIVGGYSGAAVKPIALRFISDMCRCKDLDGLHISGMGGIETWRDALEFILLGAGSVQLTTAVMQYGYRIIDNLIEGLTEYLRYKGVASLQSLVGNATDSVVGHQGIERDSIVFPVIDKDKCNGCGRCFISCMDGGHQAIEFDYASRTPKLKGDKCVGCHLCRMVCPTGAIKRAEKSIRRIGT